MTRRKYAYMKCIDGHLENALYVDAFEEADIEYEKVITKGAVSVSEPTTRLGG